MLLPPRLRPGDLVRVIAPSGPFDPEDLERGMAVLREKLGLVPRHRNDLASRYRYLAGSDARRLEEWREAVADPDARAIFCARGGFGASRLLAELDPAPLLRRPKLLVGFSDVTALHAVLNRAGLATVHGPVLTQLGRAPDSAVSHLRNLITRTGPKPGAFDAPQDGAGLLATRVLRPGRVKGPLLGGSLTLLAHLAGTPFAPQLAGAILFIEDVSEAPYRLDRSLTQLLLSGAFDRIAGIALGQFTRCDDAGVRGEEVVAEAAYALGVPAVLGIPAGHEDANFALPLGASATLVAPTSEKEGPPRLVFDGWLAGGETS